MAIQQINREHSGCRLKMVKCPNCGADLRYSQASTHIANEHVPEDFGLTPLGQA
jgi:hypothetical protein